MTNILATITVSLVSAVNTNWSTVGSMQLPQDLKSFQVQRGETRTNVFLVFDWEGTNRWVLFKSHPGEVLKEHRLLEQIPMSASRTPPPLPMNPPTFMTTNVGSVIIEKR